MGHALAGRSTLPADTQDAVEHLLQLGYGESYITRHLQPSHPGLTREKVRTIRLRREGRTHGESVIDLRDDVQQVPSIAQERVLLRAMKHALDCERGEQCLHPDHTIARELVDRGVA